MSFWAAVLSCQHGRCAGSCPAVQPWPWPGRCHKPDTRSAAQPVPFLRPLQARPHSCTTSCQQQHHSSADTRTPETHAGAYIIPRSAHDPIGPRTRSQSQPAALRCVHTFPPATRWAHRSPRLPERVFKKSKTSKKFKKFNSKRRRARLDREWPRDLQEWRYTRG